MRRLLLVILTALTASFPSSLLLLLVASPPSSKCPPSLVGCAHALPPSPSTSLGVSSAGLLLVARHGGASVAFAALSSLVASPLVASEPILGGGLMSHNALHGHGEFHVPSLKHGDTAAAAIGGIPGRGSDTFKLSVLGASKGVDPSCTYSLVEFQNNHPIEEIIIYSAHIEPSVLFPVDIADQIAPNPLEPPPPPPPLFPHDNNIDSLLQRSRHSELHIHPGSTVTVPVSIIPHYKRYYRPGSEAGSGATMKNSEIKDFAFQGDTPEGMMATLAFPSGGSASTASLNVSLAVVPSEPWEEILASTIANYNNNLGSIQLDLSHMIGSTISKLNHPPSSIIQEILPQAKIHETLLANTSWGFLRMKVPYACSVDSKEYTYGLPNNLIFMDGGGGWYARRNCTPSCSTRDDANMTTLLDSHNPFAYNIYMDNPSQVEEIQVWDVFTTQSQLVIVEVQKSTTSKPPTYYPLAGMNISPGESHVYIATIRLVPHHLNHSLLSSLTDLGFIELRTSVGDFSIALDFIPNRHRWGVVHGIGSNYSTVGNLELTKTHKLQCLQNQITSSKLWERVQSENMSIVNFYRRSDSNQSRATGQFTNQVAEQGRMIALGAVRYVEGSPVLLAQPTSINFGVITTGTRAMRVPVSLTNASPKALYVMQISVTIQMTMEDGVASLLEDPHDFSVGVDFMGGHMIPLSQNGSTYEFPHDIFISPGTSFQYPINVWCKFFVSRGHLVSPRSYIGSIVIRTTQSNEPVQRYEDWKQNTLLNDPWSQKFVTVVPFQVSVIPGNFRISTDSLLFPSHQSMLSSEELSAVKRHNKMEIPDYFDRVLEVANNFVVPIAISNMEISNSRDYGLCNSVFSIPKPDSSSGSTWQRADSNQIWKFPIRFTFTGFLRAIRFPTKCILTLETDRVGKQSLPLIIHSGELIAEVQNEEGGVLNNECVIATKDNLVKERGLACFYDWMENKSEGRVFRDAIKDIERAMKARSCPHALQAKTPAENYFLSLLSGSVLNKLEPVLMKLGAVSSGSIVTRSLLLTNMNPAPVDVTVSSASFDNMDVAIGHTPISITSALEQTPSSGDIRDFLTKSPLDRSFVSKLKYQVDISLSPRAMMGEVHSLYLGQAAVQIFQNASEFQHNEIFQQREEDMDCSAGLVLSTDGAYSKMLTSRRIGTKKWSIPPGGVARFTVTVRTPDRLELKSDLSSFVATGLALESNHGQGLPIILTYSVLLGKLHLKPSGTGIVDKDPTQISPNRVSSVTIPMVIRDNTSDIDPTGKGGVPFSIESTFSEDIFLGDIKSCNRWFEFNHMYMPKHSVPGHSKNSTYNSSSERNLLSNYLTIKGVNKSLVDSPTVLPVGRVYSAVSCSHESGDRSFFACALEWLQHRENIQPHGCGLSEEKTVTLLSVINNDDTKVPAVKSEAINVLKDAVTLLSQSQGGAFVMPNDLLAMMKAWAAWSTVSSYGLNVVTGHLAAFTVYYDGEVSIGNETSTSSGGNRTKNVHASSILSEILNDHSNLLSVPVSSVLLQSTLDVPKLFDGERRDSIGVVEFNPTHVAQTSSIYIPVSNPTGMRVRIQLASVAGGIEWNEGMFIQASSTDRHPWWTGESFWMSGKDGHVIAASHNVTFSSGTGSLVSLVNPSLQSISAFLLGCGTRCGRRSDTENAGEDVLYSTIGSGSGSRSVLLGHPWHVMGDLPPPGVKFGVVDPHPYSVGHLGVQEIVLPPYGKAKLGPVFFRPPKRGDFQSSILISNNLTGLEEVKLQGRGSWVKLVFLDNDDGTNGGDVEFRFGRSALVFSGSSATAEGHAVVKSFVLANLGDVAVNISSVSMRSSEIKHFSHRRPHPSSIFRPSSFWGLFTPRESSQHSNKCSTDSFHLVGCEVMDSPSFWLPSLHMLYTAITSIFQPSVSPEESSTTESLFDQGFTLNPNENRTFSIEHRPDCVLRASYASVVFEIRRSNDDQWSQTFLSNKLELLVGYSLGPYDYCHPYFPPKANAFEKTITFSIPSLAMDVFSLGLIGRRNGQGGEYMPLHRIEVSYIAALLILLLTLLAIDLFVSVDFPPSNDHQGFNWKQTCRCLSRADPMSADLVALGKEQTKHVLLSRFKRDNVMPTHCVLSDGGFTRDKGVDGAAGSAPNRRTAPSSQHAKTFSDAVFHRQNLLSNESKSKNPDEASHSAGLLPCGIAWKTAARRGINVSRSSSPSSAAEPQYLTRTNEVLSKKKSIQSKERIHSDIVESSVSPNIFATNMNGNYNEASNAKHEVPPQDQPISNGGHVKIARTITVHRSESVNDSSESPQIEQKTEGKLVTKPHENKPSPSKVSVITHSANQAILVEQKFEEVDDTRSKQEQATREKKLTKKGVNRTEQGKPTEQINHDTNKKRNRKVQMMKQLAEHKFTKPSTNGKAKNGLDRVSASIETHSSTQVVAVRTTQSKHAKSVSKVDTNRAIEGRRKQDSSRAAKQDISHRKVTAQSPPKNIVFSKRSISEESIPSSTPVSSAQPSPRSDSSLLTPMPVLGTGMIRPPPGLPPPPGFTDPPSLTERTSPTHHTGEDTPCLLSPQPSFTELPPSKTLKFLPEIETSRSTLFQLHHESVPSPSLLGLRSPRVDNQSSQSSPSRTFVENSRSISELLPPPPSLTPPLIDLEKSHSDIPEIIDKSTGVHDLLGSGSNFNVMSFLDIIMKDSTNQTQPEEVYNATATAANPVPLDPWNSLSRPSTRRNPLATIIGRISDVEATAFQGQDEHHEIAGIPLNSDAPSLLSPSALQSNIASIEPTYARLASEVDDDDNDSFLEPDSFYSQLLGEE
eukprot:CCRYP_016060-RA/>CCRYP_016060-RA protein AED:0.17 eAED:0.17 QI:126/1/1/1/1/1/4/2069/2789